VCNRFVGAIAAGGNSAPPVAQSEAGAIRALVDAVKQEEVPHNTLVTLLYIVCMRMLAGENTRAYIEPRQGDLLQRCVRGSFYRWRVTICSSTNLFADFPVEGLPPQDPTNKLGTLIAKAKKTVPAGKPIPFMEVSQFMPD